MYERRAGLALGRDPKFLGLPFASEWIRQQGHSMKTAVNAVAGTVGMAAMQCIAWQRMYAHMPHIIGALLQNYVHGQWQAFKRRAVVKESWLQLYNIIVCSVAF